MEKETDVLFSKTLETICTEVKNQFSKGAERIVLTRDGDYIFCEPDDYIPTINQKENYNGKR